jgi:hypothetical protein
MCSGSYAATSMVRDDVHGLDANDPVVVAEEVDEALEGYKLAIVPPSPGPDGLPAESRTNHLHPGDGDLPAKPKRTSPSRTASAASTPAPPSSW